MDYKYYKTREELDRANPPPSVGGSRIGIKPLVIDITEELFRRKDKIQSAESREMIKRVKVKRFTRFEDVQESLITLRRVIDTRSYN